MSIQVDLDYVKSPPGILKIVEFVLLLIAFSALANANYGDSRYHFFLFVTVTLWLAVMILFALFLTKLHEKVDIPWVLVMMIFHGVASLFLLIVFALIADSAVAFHNAKFALLGYTVDFCETYKVCGNYDVAAAFGFFSLVAFVLDCAFFVRKFMKSRQTTGESPDKSSKSPEQQATA